MTQFENTSAFKAVILQHFEQDGWTATLAPPNTLGYDIELVRGSEYVAVQVKHQRAKVHAGQLEKFIDFLERPAAAKFTQGFLLSASGFTASVFTYMRTEEVVDVALGSFKDNQIVWEDGDIPQPPPRAQLTYIGVFTCKGGVGKTTISAHLAGAFALNGYDVVLIDLDRQSNLRKLLGDGVYIPGRRGGLGATITVLNHTEWREEEYPDTRVVICDCSPEYDANPEAFIEKFNYCLIPTTLNPLGINKNADVIRRTFAAVRRININAELFVIVNNYHSDESRRNEVLNRILKTEFETLMADDSKCHYIDPETVAIRFSKQLLYWGYHIVENDKPQLAFREVGGRSLPRTDFLKLLDYLEDHTNIEAAKEKEAKAPVG
ncbi:AAA family ATPase [Phormidium sp. FACHB-592]|uniref:AAA family ATPase n=1 Tax=Stenomitos frigidus AS-A4 TaxID=2933935 RepID=A0ABV0KD58_9CYAN|nr:AAA family ATPase [Phormidium sp. FACHB-592]MBD2077791.1 AAA family ATPase [Phormidium sp. FACHB-592]